MDRADIALALRRGRRAVSGAAGRRQHPEALDTPPSSGATGSVEQATRRPNGTVLPGHTPNPGGRPVTAIQELRARYLHHLPGLMEGLFELATRSPNEMVRLAAIREILDRLLGKPPVAIDTTVAKVDVAELCHSALRRAGLGAASDLTE
jgi:hypothetical protein